MVRDDSVTVRRAGRITLTAEEWAQLRRWIVDRRTPVRVRRRARILLGAALGRSNREIARTLALDPATVSFWRRRFVKHRLDGGLVDAPRPTRRNDASTLASERILHATYAVAPPGAQRWTTRALARHLGVNHMQVHRTWKSARVAPPSSPVRGDGAGPSSVFRRVDLLGVALQPPRRAVVFGVERSAATSFVVDRAHSVPIQGSISGGFLLNSDDSDPEELAMLMKRVEPLVGREPGISTGWHDLLILLRELERRVPPTTELHVVVENCDAAEARRLASWFRGHPRCRLHETPAGTEWPEYARGLFELWASGAGALRTFGGMASFASAAAHFAAATSTEPRGLVWNRRGATGREAHVDTNDEPSFTSPPSGE